MKRQSIGVGFLLGALLLAMWAAPATAQSAITPVDEEELRYEFVAHNFTVDGVDQEVYLKLDSFTGRTWRFSAHDPKWNAISEAENSRSRSSSNQSRYELLAHNYVDKNGEPQELFIRSDAITGYTWVYRGADGTWMDISQE